MKRYLTFSTLSVALLVAGSAHAWKPVMHASLADVVLDSLRNSPNGLSIEAVWNYNQLSSGGTLGTFDVDPLVRQAVLSHPEQFRAGVLGPDAFPDLLTGQSVIHAHDDHAHDPGTDGWLRRLWHAAYVEAQTTGHDEPLAFMAGFLVHGAGDIFAHTFVNHYAGGPFEITTDNAQRHIIVEGYVAEFIPDPQSYVFSIRGVEQFIYDNMIDATRKPHTDLHAMYMRKAASATSFPLLFSELRSVLEDMNETSRSLPGPLWVADGPARAYRGAWQSDIDRGLRELPNVSERVARATMLNPNRSMDRVALERALDDYRRDYVMSMLGAPDLVVGFVNLIERALEAVVDAFQIPDPFKAIKRRIMDHFVEEATGLTVSEWEDALQNPACGMVAEPTLSGVQGNLCNPTPRVQLSFPVCPKNLGEDCRNEVDTRMGLNPGRTEIDWAEFAPAYNTVLMSKLIFLSETGRRGLMSSLGFPVGRPLAYDPRNSSAPINNTMIGFIRSLDDSREWGAHAEQSLPHFDCYLYQKLFLRQLNDSSNATDPLLHYGGGIGQAVKQCPDLSGISLSLSDGATGPICRNQARFEVRLDSPAGTHGAVVDLHARGPAWTRDAFVSPGNDVAYVNVDLRPVLSPQAVFLDAQRMGSDRARVDVRPPEPAIRVERRAVGGNVPVLEGDTILGGQTLLVQAMMDCPLVVTGESIYIRLVDSQDVIHDVVVLTGEEGTTSYVTELEVPYVLSDEDFEVRIYYAGSNVTRGFTALGSRVLGIYFDRETAVTGLTSNQITATLQLGFSPGQPELVHLQYSPGLSGPASITLQPGEAQRDFPVHVGPTGYSAACQSSVGWMEAVSDHDAPQAGLFTGRERYAEIVLQPSSFSSTCLDGLVPDDRLQTLEYLSAPFLDVFPPLLFEPEDGILDPRIGPRPGPD